MKMKPHVATDPAIRAAAAANGFVDCMVQTVSSRDLDTGKHESWQWLSLKREAGGVFELIGRRRTNAELIKLIEQTGQKSMAPVGTR